MDYRSQLVSLAETYSAAVGLSEARIANLAKCDSRFFERMREGKGCRVDTMIRVIRFFSENWPNDRVAWPEFVDRPQGTGAAA